MKLSSSASDPNRRPDWWRLVPQCAETQRSSLKSRAGKIETGLSAKPSARHFIARRELQSAVGKGRLLRWTSVRRKVELHRLALDAQRHGRILPKAAAPARHCKPNA